MLTTNVHEIADGVYRLSTCVPEVAPGGFTFNQFLITGDEPVLFHTGTRQLYPLVAEAIGKIIPIESLRWITFGHVESDECGAMNLLLTAAPAATVTFNPLGCDVSLNDLCDRPPQVLDGRSAARHRWSSPRHPLDTARAPRLGGTGPLRCDHQDAVLRRPADPDR